MVTRGRRGVAAVAYFREHHEPGWGAPRQLSPSTQPRGPPPPASMQPRRPPPPALLLSLWLLPSLALAAAASAPADPQYADVPRQSPAVGLPRGILQLAARVALHFFNFRAGSPSALRVLAAVQEGRAWVSEPRRGGTRSATTALPARACVAEPSNATSAFLVFPRPEILSRFGNVRKGSHEQQPLVGIPCVGRLLACALCTQSTHGLDAMASTKIGELFQKAKPALCGADKFLEFRCSWQATVQGFGTKW